jgi:hypothetical protein
MSSSNMVTSTLPNKDEIENLWRSVLIDAIAKVTHDNGFN